MIAATSPLFSRPPASQGPFRSFGWTPRDGLRWAVGLRIDAEQKTDPMYAVALKMEEWDVRERGYEDGGVWLVAEPGLFYPGRESRLYDPLSVPDLHRRFARVVSLLTTARGTSGRMDRAIRAVERFASKFGFLGPGMRLLGPGESVQVRYVVSDIGGSGGLYAPADKMSQLVGDIGEGEWCEGEPFMLWLDEARLLATYIGFWDLARSESSDLRRYVRWELNPRRVEIHAPIYWGEPETKTEVMASEDDPKTAFILDHWETGDIVAPTLQAVADVVNHRLNGHVSPYLGADSDGDVRFWPDSLLTAMYVSFMLEMSGRRHPARLCAAKGCGKYFNPTHGLQLYCNEKCRANSWYHRHKDPTHGKEGATDGEER